MLEYIYQNTYLLKSFNFFSYFLLRYVYIYVFEIKKLCIKLIESYHFQELHKLSKQISRAQ